MKRLVEYWRDGYDWRKEEEKINRELEMFTRDISVVGVNGGEGEVLNVHYVHRESGVEGAIPLLFIHGCESLSSLSNATFMLFIRARKLPRSI